MNVIVTERVVKQIRGDGWVIWDTLFVLFQMGGGGGSGGFSTDEALCLKQPLVSWYIVFVIIEEYLKPFNSRRDSRSDDKYQLLLSQSISYSLQL